MKNLQHWKRRGKSPRDLGTKRLWLYLSEEKDAELLKCLRMISEMSGLSLGQVAGRLLKNALYKEMYGEELDLLPNEVDLPPIDICDVDIEEWETP